MIRILKRKNGITLIALVVTIIVLIILAGVSISLVLGENGIIKKARDARENFLIATEKEETILNELYVDIKEAKFSKGPNGKILVNKDTITTTNHEKIVGEDKLGNQVVIPDGFKIAQDSGETVKVGIVIEDDSGNQYVWVPVSNINHDGSNKIKVNSADDEGVEITLGRYLFEPNPPPLPNNTIVIIGEDGNEIIEDTSSTNTPGDIILEQGSYQYGVNYTETVMLGDVSTSKNFQEIQTYIQSNGLGDTTGTNTTARGVMENGSYNGIKGFIESVRDNKGFYIARYESSYREDGKAGSKVSTSGYDTLMLGEDTGRTGELWNQASQGQAALACYDLYPGKVNSDLINSYAWDTAIVYIQAMGNINYANSYDGNGTLRNTGTTEDEKCKIFDMAGNEREWTTEYSSYTSGSYAYPCVGRGGYCWHYSSRTRNRGSFRSNETGICCFRSVLYL